MEGWIETKLENGFKIPLPVGYENFSGKFIVRIPKSLHYKLTIEAEKEGVSLNQYALYKLSCFWEVSPENSFNLYLFLFLILLKRIFCLI